MSTKLEEEKLFLKRIGNYDALVKVKSYTKIGIRSANCSHCSERVRVRVNGTAYKHDSGWQTCPGSGEPVTLFDITCPGCRSRVKAHKTHFTSQVVIAAHHATLGPDRGSRCSYSHLVLNIAEDFSHAFES